MEWVKTTISKIVDKKQQSKSQLHQLKNKYIVIIYKGIAKNESIKSIHQKLFAETINTKKVGKITSDQMLKIAILSTDKLKKKYDASFVGGKNVKAKYGALVEKSSLTALASIFAFDLIKSMQVEKALSKEISELTNKQEEQDKKKAIQDNIEHNRKLEDPKIFYLASSHKDSATDHKDYQGKVYVDEQWETFIKDENLKKLIKSYISVHNVKTIQWVMGDPVWFITRPNCRHYFKAMSVTDILSYGVTELLNRNNMVTAIGDRQYLQTMKHKTKKEWYQDLRNAELLLEKYKERLKLHQEMMNVQSNPILKDAIIKDKMLIAKWEKYINERKKL